MSRFLNEDTVREIFKGLAPIIETEDRSKDILRCSVVFGGYKFTWRYPYGLGGHRDHPHFLVRSVFIQEPNGTKYSAHSYQTIRTAMRLATQNVVDSLTTVRVKERF